MNQKTNCSGQQGRQYRRLIGSTFKQELEDIVQNNKENTSESFLVNVNKDELNQFTISAYYSELLD